MITTSADKGGEGDRERQRPMDMRLHWRITEGEVQGGVCGLFLGALAILRVGRVFSGLALNTMCIGIVSPVHVFPAG